MRRCAVSLMSVLALSACTVGPLDLQGRAGPCAEGWTCDPITRTCRGGVFSDGGRRDAGRFDAGRPDTGPDAEPQDAGPTSPSSCDALAERGDVLVCDGFEDGL